MRSALLKRGDAVEDYLQLCLSERQINACDTALWGGAFN